MADRRVKVIFEAEIAKFKQGMSDAAKETEKLAKATEATGKSVDERMQKINAVAAADQKAAKAAGLLYNAQGQLADSNGKVLSSTQAAAHGVEAFSEAVYLSGHEASVAAAATEAAAKKAAEAAEKQKAAWQTVAPVMAAAGAGIVAGVGMSVAKFASFDKAMSSVQAATHETAGNMALLRQAAIDAGADTAFSAEEAAQGIEELAKAGVSTESIMGGGLTGALSLAAAGALGVGESAEIAASAMTQFKLEGDQIPHLADLLAAGAGKAQGSVQDLGAALNQSGLVASATGLTIEETTGALAAFASAGLVGSDSGTSLKTMLQALTPVSDKAANLMEELGISAYDANGEFIGMSEYAGVLRGALQNMSAEQRNATMKTIFGSDAVRAANVLYEQGAEGIEKWESAVNDAGYAAETASIMQDNLAGDLEKLGGAFDTVFIQSGGAGNDALRVLVQSLEGVIDVIGQIPAPVLGVGTILAGIGGGALLLGGGLITAIPKIKDTADALRDIIPAGSRADRALRGAGKGAAAAGKAAGVATVAMVALGAAVAAHNAEQGAAKGSGAFAKDLADLASGAKTAGELFSNINIGEVDGYLDTVDGIGAAFDRLNPKFGDIRGHLAGFGADVLGVNNDVAKVQAEFAGWDETLAAAVQSGNAEDAAEGFAKIRKEAQEQGVPMEKLNQLFPQYKDALAGVAATAPEASEATEELQGALDEVGVSAQGAVTDMEAFLEALFTAGVITRDERGALRQYEEAIDGIAASIKENGKSMDETTAKGRANQESFDGLAASGQAYVEALAAGGATEKELQEAMTGTYDSLITAAGQFDITGEKADALARGVMGIPEDVKVSSWMSDAAKRTAEQTKSAIDAIPKSTTVYTHYKTTGSQAGPLKINPRDVLMDSFIPGKAAGGEIAGRGAKGVDSELIMAAPGEHMLTAHEVDLMGGQDAVYRFRTALVQGIPAYASGGAIGVSAASIMATQSAQGGGGGMNVQLTINGATDARAVARAVEDKLTSKFAKVGMRIG